MTKAHILANNSDYWSGMTEQHFLFGVKDQM